MVCDNCSNDATFVLEDSAGGLFLCEDCYYDLDDDERDLCDRLEECD